MHDKNPNQSPVRQASQRALEYLLEGETLAVAVREAAQEYGVREDLVLADLPLLARADPAAWVEQAKLAEAAAARDTTAHRVAALHAMMAWHDSKTQADRTAFERKLDALEKVAPTEAADIRSVTLGAGRRRNG